MGTTTISALLDTATFPGALFYGAIVIAFAWLAGSILHLVTHRYLDRAETTGTDSTSIRFLAQLARVFVYIVAFAFYTYLIPSLHALGAAWLASVGLFSIIIGLATQSTLSNLIAGISVILYRPFRIGERIQVSTPSGPEIGVVESIDLGYSSLRTADGRRVVMPNSLIASQTNINFSRNKANILLEIPIVITSSKDIDNARTILLNTAKDINHVTKVNGTFVTNLTKDGATLMTSVMCLDPGDIAGIKSDFFEKVHFEFDAAGIMVG